MHFCVWRTHLSLPIQLNIQMRLRFKFKWNSNPSMLNTWLFWIVRQTLRLPLGVCNVNSNNNNNIKVSFPGAGFFHSPVNCRCTSWYIFFTWSTPYVRFWCYRNMNSIAIYFSVRIQLDFAIFERIPLKLSSCWLCIISRITEN